MADIDTAVKNVVTETTTVALTPGYEGANIGTYIGFKHVNYLVEKAVIEHFRRQGLPVGALYEQYGLGFDLVELEAPLRGGVFVDDEAVLEVRPVTGGDGTAFRFKVTITVLRDGEPKKIVTASAAAVLRRDEDDRRLPGRVTAPAVLDRFTVASLGTPEPGEAVAGTGAQLPSGGSTDQDPVLDQLLAGRNGYGWKLRVPYPYVHFFDRMHMSAYLRQMEEAKHRFVDARGISIGAQLAERNWIPAVTHSRIEILGEALLEEDLYTVYTVESIFKTLLYTARMDCYVVREGRLVRMATGVITHGYGVVENGNQARVVSWDDRIDRALKGLPGEES
nr:Pep16 [Streptomyces sp. NAK02211]